MPSRRLNELSAKEWVKFTKSWFILNPPPRRKEEILHPAKFPEALVERFLRFFTHRYDWVLDPFVGVGSTLVACQKLARNGVGIEIVPKYVEIARKRLSQRTLLDVKQIVICGNALYLDKYLEEYNIPPIDFCITSPPYWRMLRTSRGNADSVAKKRAKQGLDVSYPLVEGNLENIEDYDEFLDALETVFFKVYEAMKSNRYLVVITQNIRVESGEMKPLAWDLARRLAKKFILKQEMIWCQDNKPLNPWGYPYEYVSNVHHHYCLVFKKP